MYIYVIYIIYAYTSSQDLMNSRSKKASCVHHFFLIKIASVVCFCTFVKQIFQA